MVWVLWDKRAKDVEKKPSDVRYCYFYNKRILYLFQFKGRAFFQWIFPANIFASLSLWRPLHYFWPSVNQFVDMLYTKKVEDMNDSHYQTLISFYQIEDAFFLLYQCSSRVHDSKIYRIIKQTFYTSHLGLYNYPMGGQLHLSQGPTIEIFCVPNKLLTGIGIDKDMKNWEFKNSQIILDDWTTFEIIIQDRHWTQ